MGKLSINTKESLFDPIVIEINGVEYTLPEINTRWLKKAGEFDARINKGEVEAASEFLHEMIGVPLKIAEKIPIRSITYIRLFIVKEMENIELIEPKQNTTESKNVSSDGSDAKK